MPVSKIRKGLLLRYLIYFPLIVFLTLAATLFCLRLYASYRDAVVAREYLPGDLLWKKESEIGYVNQENISQELLGGIRIETNSSGHRATVEVGHDRPSGATRVLGVGDSIMWGLRLKAEDTFLEVAKRALAGTDRSYEFINAGVIGYSTLQERLYLMKYGLPFHPDIVVLSYCPNDWLPSEDIFGQGLAVYKNYFRYLLANTDRFPLSMREVHILRVLLKEEELNTMYSLFWKDETLRDSFRKILIEIPLVQMLHATRDQGARLIVVFTPNQFYSEKRLQTIEKLQGLLRLMQGEYIDVRKPLVEPEYLYADFHNPLPAFEDTPIARFLKRTRISKLVAAVGAQDYDPYQLAGNLSKLQQYEKMNIERNFSDWVHPTRKGAWIIGTELAGYLKSSHPGGIESSG